MAKVRINIDPTDRILLKRNLNKNGKAQRFFTGEVRRLSDTYTPFKTGQLKQQVRVEANKLTYTQPYAKKQYYENKGNGIRGKQWVPRMWADKGKSIVQSVAKFVGGKAR